MAPRRDTRERRSRLAFLGTLASGLAHEIKNPLSAMSINLQMMREDLEQSERAQDRRTLKRIGIVEREVLRLEEILEGFLKFARGFSLEPKPQSVNVLLREIVEFWAARANASGIDVELVLGSDLPDAYVDATYFKQAVLNLLNNAQEAITGDENRDEAREQIVVGSRSHPRGVEVLVIDSGPGISADALENIFEPYFSTKATGSGLGLPTVKRILDEHGGDITVESEPGRGTSFRLVLPSSRTEPASRSSDPPEDPPDPKSKPPPNPS